jgi:hypothetical protein
LALQARGAHSLKGLLCPLSATVQRCHALQTLKQYDFLQWALPICNFFSHAPFAASGVVEYKATQDDKSHYNLQLRDRNNQT